MNARHRTPDRLERIERSVLGVVLMIAVAWAVVGGQHGQAPLAPSFAAATSR